MIYAVASWPLPKKNDEKITRIFHHRCFTCHDDFPLRLLDFLISFPFLFLFGYFPFRFHMHSSTRRHYYSSFLLWRFDGMKKCFPSLSVTFLRVSLSFSRRPLSIWERRKQQRHRYSAHRQSHWRLIQHFKRRRPPFHFLNLLINDIPSKASPV